MRPHKLVMTAFGPFAAETVVDFDSMGNNIYLISGATGAGKTTIFDGIIYALYGTASGGARSSLGTEAFHSDYAKDGKHRNEMRVELEFSNAGRKFTVSRKMYWGKKGDAQNAIKEAFLSENGNTLVYAKGREDKDDVTRKVTEILGLDADQFRRIIMLAQGEFQKFLTAKSEERGAILGKLYDNRRHQDFQMRLKASRKFLEEKEKDLVNSGKAQINLFVFPDDAGEEIRSAITIDHPALLSLIDQLIGQMNSELTELSERIEKQNRDLDELKQKKSKGETQNGLLDALSGKKNELTILEKKSDQISALRGKVQLAIAAEKVLPAEGTMLRAEKDWKDALSRIQKLEIEGEVLANQHNELQDRLTEVTETNIPRIEILEKQKAAIQGILHFYDDMAESADEYDKKKKTHENAATGVKNAQNILEQKKRRQKELSDLLQKLASAGEAEVQNAERALNDIKTRQSELKAIRDGISSVHTLMKEKSMLEDKAEKAAQAEAAAEAEHHRLYTAFIQGQAGILAKDLRERLKKEESVCCPVCGSVHTSKDELSFAHWSEDIPTSEAVDKAYAFWDKARKTRKEAENNLSENNLELQSQKNGILDKAKALLSASDWELLAAGEALKAAENECDAAHKEARNRFDKAKEDRTAKETATAEKETVDREFETAEKGLADAEKAEHAAATEAATAENSMNNWKEQLKDYPEKKKDAENLLDSIGKEIDDFQREIDKADEACSNCVTEQAKNKGNLENARTEQTAKEQSKNAAKNAFIAQLNRYSFADAEAYHSALSPDNTVLNQDTVSDWITGKQAELAAYDRECNDHKSAIQQLTESTRGMSYADITEIRSQIDELSEMLKAQTERKEKLSSDVNRNRDVQLALTRIQKQRSKYSKVFEKLNPLVDTADGKYAFSRYVLTGFFHRIVEQANIHLETMTDGEYCLIPKESGDGRSNIGLELKVLNTITNMERDTGSLSGGQLFEASLSLALGLSDVVQMESASSIRIDSMFIDEGFGSLDGGRLDKALEVLQHLSAGKRQIGIISHVARLDECLPKKIHVIAGDRGSSVRIETDM